MPSKVMLYWFSSSCWMRHCLLACLVDMPVDIPSSTSQVEATTIVPINSLDPGPQKMSPGPAIIIMAFSPRTGILDVCAICTSY
jgi:hypothetical protein